MHRYERTVNQVMGDLFRVIKERELDQQLHILSMPIPPPEHLARMVRMIDQGKISGKIAKALFEELLDSGESPEKIVREKGLEEVSDLSSLEKRP